MGTIQVSRGPLTRSAHDGQQVNEERRGRHTLVGVVGAEGEEVARSGRRMNSPQPSRKTTTCLACTKLAPSAARRSTPTTMENPTMLFPVLIPLTMPYLPQKT